MQKYRSLFIYARPHARTFGLLIVLSLASSLLVALQPWPIKIIVDSVLQNQPLPASIVALFSWIGLSPAPGVVLTVFASASLIVAGLHVACDASQAWNWTRAGRRIVFDLAESLFARLQRRSLIFHSRTPVGDTISCIGKDSWCVYLALDAAVISPLSSIFAVAGMAWLMSRLDGRLALVALLCAPLMVLASFLVGKPLRAAANLKREIEGRLASHLHQTLSGIPVVQAFVQEDREQARFHQFANAAIRAQQRSTLLGSFNSLSSGLVTTLGSVVILWFGSQRVLEGTLTIGSLLVFLVYLGALQAQLKSFASAWTTVQGLSASLERARTILETPSEIVDRPNARPLSHPRGAVRFENVVFGYETGRPVLAGINFEAQPGETVALVGATGAGKSTLVNLLPRFFDPWDGRVLIDGCDIRDLHLADVRQNIGLVLQDACLAPISIADNIAFGRPDATRAEIEAAAHAARADEFIRRLPEGYDTVLEERGATLSGGERQRLAIARAVLKNAPILILDEPTSALDALTEREILEALERLRQGRTTFIIAHRLSTVRQADRILVLENGRIVESGTHAALLARDQIYSRLHRVQFGRASAHQEPA